MLVPVDPLTIEGKMDLASLVAGFSLTEMNRILEATQKDREFTAYWVGRREAMLNNYVAATISGEREVMADAIAAYRLFQQTAPPEFIVKDLAEIVERRTINRALREKGLPSELEYIKPHLDIRRLYRDPRVQRVSPPLLPGRQAGAESR